MKTIWIVDGAYLFGYGRNKPFDYLKLKAEIERLNGGALAEAHYLNSVPDVGSAGQNNFHAWLKSAPPRGPKLRVQLYSLKDLHTTCPSCSHSHIRAVQKGVDVGIATLMFKLAVRNAFDRLILSTGDGDLEDAVDFVKREFGKEVWVHGAQASLSVDLQSCADRVLWLDDMHPTIDKVDVQV